MQASSNGKNLAFSKYVDNLWFFLIFLLFFGLFLFLITLASQKTAMIFRWVYFSLVVRFLNLLLHLSPRYGEKVLDAFDYIPFAYLTDKMISSNFDFSNWQWVISLGSIVIFFILNILYVAKKDI